MVRFPYEKNFTPILDFRRVSEAKITFMWRQKENNNKTRSVKMKQLNVNLMKMFHFNAQILSFWLLLSVPYSGFGILLYIYNVRFLCYFSTLELL